MTNIVALLREAAGHIAKYSHMAHRTIDERLFAAADELEASAEWALCKWLAEDEDRRCRFLSVREWYGALWDGVGGNVDSEGETRADAIRAAIKAWEER